MHSPEVVVFDVHVPLPRIKWKQSARERRWEWTRRRYTCHANENPLCGEAISPWWRPEAWQVAAAGRRIGLVELATVWHMEPGGADSGEVCKGMGGSELTRHNLVWAWRHRTHLHIQWHHWQRTRNWLFLRCARCGLPFRGAYRARIGTWDGDAREVRHRDCDLIEHLQRRDEVLARYIRTGEDAAIARLWAEASGEEQR